MSAPFETRSNVEPRRVGIADEVLWEVYFTLVRIPLGRSVRADLALDGGAGSLMDDVEGEVGEPFVKFNDGSVCLVCDDLGDGGMEEAVLGLVVVVM